jgi:hypothetical protein
VRYVLVGSVAALAYGAEIGEPGDLDITPALDRQNLTRLRAVLDDIEAGPEADAPFGHWEPRPDGELRWIVDETTPELLAQRANWRPDPGDPRTFDTLLCSRLGSFDIVPELGGTYDTLMKRAVRLRVWEHDLWVVHLDELLAALTVPRRPKDVPRVRQLRAIQRVRGEQARAQTGDERGAI